MVLECRIGIAKIKKYATSTSGDTVEVIERPNGGLSVVMADGQSSGKGAKWVSSFVVRKVISLLAEGVRDGAAARAASDALYTERGGRVSATLNVLSLDKQTDTLVITRNNPAPAILVREDRIVYLNETCKPVGLYRGTRPSITEISVEANLSVVMYTDGIVHAGSRYGQSMDVITCIQALLDEEDPTPQVLADALLSYALTLEQGRPSDDISVVVLRVVPGTGDLIRRMSVRLPLGP